VWVPVFPHIRFWSEILGWSERSPGIFLWGRSWGHRISTGSHTHTQQNFWKFFWFVYSKRGTYLWVMKNENKQKFNLEQFWDERENETFLFFLLNFLLLFIGQCYSTPLWLVCALARLTMFYLLVNFISIFFAPLM